MICVRVITLSLLSLHDSQNLFFFPLQFRCNEDLMKMELVTNGPMAVSFEVYSDFQQYKGGIYHHTGLRSGFNPFLITNHAVLAVGYGIDRDTGEKYWIVKNSWGTSWGENGFFRIRRGTDECSIESIAVGATIIP